MRTHRLIAMLGSFVLAVAAVGTASGESGDAKIGNTPKNVGAAVPAPPLDSKRLDSKRLDQIQRTGEVGRQLGAIRELDELRGARELKDLGAMREVEERFEDSHIGTGDRVDEHEVIRKLFLGRDVGTEENVRGGPVLGQPGSGQTGNTFSGAGTAAGALGVPTSDGRAAYVPGKNPPPDPVVPVRVGGPAPSSGPVVVSEDGGHEDSTDTSWNSTEYSDGSSATNSHRNNGDGTYTERSTRTRSDGTMVITVSQGTYGRGGGTMHSYTRRKIDKNGNLIGSVAGTYDSQGAPTDDVIDPDADPTNPATGLGGKKAWGDPMAIVKQPVHGDAETGTSGRSSTSRLGTAVVTNPDNHDGSSGRGGGGGGIGSNQPDGDPEPDIPGGSTTAAAVGMNAESLGSESLGSKRR